MSRLPPDEVSRQRPDGLARSVGLWVVALVLVGAARADLPSAIGLHRGMVTLFFFLVGGLANVLLLGCVITAIDVLFPSKRRRHNVAPTLTPSGRREDNKQASL